MLLTLYTIIALISISLLIPVYYYGTDVSYNTNYITFWSKITIAHLEQNSLMNYVPILIIIVITVATMLLYNQFTLIYVYFRQRCLKRVVP